MSHPLRYQPLDKKLPQSEAGVVQMRDDLQALQKALEGAVEATARFLSARRELQAAWPQLQDLAEDAPEIERFQRLMATREDERYGAHQALTDLAGRFPVDTEHYLMYAATTAFVDPEPADGAQVDDDGDDINEAGIGRMRADVAAHRKVVVRDRKRLLRQLMILQQRSKREQAKQQRLDACLGKQQEALAPSASAPAVVGSRGRGAVVRVVGGGGGGGAAAREAKHADAADAGAADIVGGGAATAGVPGPSSPSAAADAVDAGEEDYAYVPALRDILSALLAALQRVHEARDKLLRVRSERYILRYEDVLADGQRERDEAVATLRKGAYLGGGGGDGAAAVDPADPLASLGLPQDHPHRLLVRAVLQAASLEPLPFEVLDALAADIGAFVSATRPGDGPPSRGTQRWREGVQRQQQRRRRHQELAAHREAARAAGREAGARAQHGGGGFMRQGGRTRYHPNARVPAPRAGGVVDSRRKPVASAAASPKQQNRRIKGKGKGRGKGKGGRLSAPQWEGGKPLRAANRRSGGGGGGTMGKSKRLAPGLAALAVREVESEAHGKGADALSGMGFQVSKCT